MPSKPPVRRPLFESPEGRYSSLDSFKWSRAIELGRVKGREHPGYRWIKSVFSYMSEDARRTFYGKFADRSEESRFRFNSETLRLGELGPNTVTALSEDRWKFEDIPEEVIERLRNITVGTTVGVHRFSFKGLGDEEKRRFEDYITKKLLPEALKHGTDEQGRVQVRLDFVSNTRADGITHYYFIVRD